jgi:hypothetical protein
MQWRTVFIVILTVLMTACGLSNSPENLVGANAAAFADDTTETDEANLETPDEDHVIEGAIGPGDFPENMNPLTGLEVENPETLNRRPMVVKISNAPPLVRPQAGIGQADLVFEHYAEGGLTRFSAVFYGQSPERVGSIRSARLIDYELVPMYQGLLLFSGASIGVEQRINESEFFERTYKGVLYGLPYFWRDEQIEVPHNMFANPAAIWQLAEEEGFGDRPDLQGMAFHPDAPAGDSGEAEALDIRYVATRVRWEYDEESGLYKRFSDGEPHLDANTDEQVTAANVIVLYADHQYTDIIESQWQDSISYSIEIKVWFEGDMLLLRDGKQYAGHWRRPTREMMISPRTADDEGWLYLKPGNTWIQLVRLPEQQDPAEEGVEVIAEIESENGES